MGTLKDWAPYEFSREFYDVEAYKFKDVEVVREFCRMEDTERHWPGTHKNVQSWVILANNKAIGFNENASVGWSFPVIHNINSKIDF